MHIHLSEFYTAVLMTVLILSLGLIYILLRNTRRKKRVNVKLRLQKAEMQALNEELTRLVGEITQQKETLQHHVTTLLEFSKSKVVNFGTTLEAARDIVRLTAHTLRVSRVSIWLYQEETHMLEPVVGYDLHADSYLSFQALDLTKFPQYEAALRSTRIIDAPDARVHPGTHEFTEAYLAPHDIHSMLDITFSMDGRLNGLICCEQQQAQREWKAEDIIFASSVADITSLAYRSAQRRDYEKRLRQQAREIARMNEQLEQRVQERTAELETRNEQLTEYAFINSHLLRSPVSKILGLINLLNIDGKGDPREMLGHLKIACDDLDAIVKSITVALEDGSGFDRRVIVPKVEETKRDGE